MTFTTLPPEITCMIVQLLPRRRDLAALHRTCKGTHHVLQQYRDNIIGICKRQDKVDFARPSISPSSPKTFLTWMRVEFRHDDIIMEESHRLFYLYYHERDDAWSERQVRERDARLIVRHMRDHIGDDRFLGTFETLVQEWSPWARDVVSALSADDKDNDEIVDNHELALRLTRAAMKMLKVHVRQPHEDEADRHLLDYEIHQWALAQEEVLLLIRPLAAARFAKSMLDDALAQEVPHDGRVQAWAHKCLSIYDSVFVWSVIQSVDEGEFAERMLGTIQRYPDYPRVQDWADRSLELYAICGMPVHAIGFAKGMLEVSRSRNPDTAELSSKWEQRCLEQERKEAGWKKAGDLAQAMLRA